MRTRLLPLLLAATSVAATPQAAPSAADLAAALQAKYAAVTDFSADFVHTYRGGVLKNEAVERGTVLIKKPGRMRWTYFSPERKVFVADGRRIYSYIPEDRQVIISEVPSGDEATTPALFLTGKGHLTRDFVVSIPDVADATPNTHTLKFTPRRREAEYDWMVLVINRTTLQIRTLVTGDAQGGQSTFVFSNIRENAGIPDSQFQFTVPRGVDVVTRTPRPAPAP
jgi:outer membrane lipoprotein carrier protein